MCMELLDALLFCSSESFCRNVSMCLLFRNHGDATAYDFQKCENEILQLSAELWVQLFCLAITRRHIFGFTCGNLVFVSNALCVRVDDGNCVFICISAVCLEGCNTTFGSCSYPFECRSGLHYITSLHDKTVLP